MTKIYLVENCYGDKNKVYIGKTKNSRKKDHRKTYGEQITYIIIDEVNSLDHKDWKPLECFWISYFRFLGFDVLNKNEGGGGPDKYTEEQKQRMRHPKCKEHGSNVSKALKGKPRPWVSKNLTGSIRYSYRKPINQYDLNGNFIRTWSSSKEAGNELNIDIGTLVSCLKGRQKTCNKFKWKYITHDQNTNLKYLS